jgi:hypothetical protein
MTELRGEKGVKKEVRKVLCEMVINTVNIGFSSLLTSLTLGKNHPKAWKEEEDKTVADLIEEYKTWAA